MVKVVKFSLVPVVALLLMALWVQGVFAHGGVDQSNEGLNVRARVVIALNSPIGQEFTPAQSTLTGVDLFLTSVNPDLGVGENITVNIRKGAINSAVIASSRNNRVVRKADGFVHFHFRPTIDVVVGDVYVFEVVAGVGSHAMTYSSGNEYPGGRAFWADINPGIPILFEDRDFLFRTYYKSMGP